MSFVDPGTKEMRIVVAALIEDPFAQLFSPSQSWVASSDWEKKLQNLKSHLPQKRTSNVYTRVKGGSSSSGEREENMALLQPRKTLHLKTADKIWAGYCFCLGAWGLFSVGSPPRIQISSRKMSRPALRLTCFSLPSLSTPSPRRTLSSLKFKFLLPRLDLTHLPLDYRFKKKKKGGSP